MGQQVMIMPMPATRVWALATRDDAVAPVVYESMDYALIAAERRHSRDGNAGVLRWERVENLGEWWGMAGAGKSSRVAYRVYPLTVHGDPEEHDTEPLEVLA